MKYNRNFLTLFSVIVLTTTTLLSQIIAQNVLSISVDPEYATTVFINFDKELKVETWDEPYILFQIEMKPHSEAKEAMIFLELHKQNIIKQEFTVNDFLYLTIPDLDKILQLDDCDHDQLFNYKIIAPKRLDLELRCKNDMVVYDDFQNDYPFDVENIKAHNDK